MILVLEPSQSVPTVQDQVVVSHSVGVRRTRVTPSNGRVRPYGNTPPPRFPATTTQNTPFDPLSINSFRQGAQTTPRFP